MRYSFRHVRHSKSSLCFFFIKDRFVGETGTAFSAFVSEEQGPNGSTTLGGSVSPVVLDVL